MINKSFKSAQVACRICKCIDCDNDCEELAAIYREQQREKLRDIDIDEITCDVCGLTYGQESHDLCHYNLNELE